MTARKTKALGEVARDTALSEAAALLRAQADALSTSRVSARDAAESLRATADQLDALARAEVVRDW